MADVDGHAVLPFSEPGHSSAGLSADGYFAASQRVGGLSLREVIIAGLASIEGFPYRYPFVIVERACIAEDVDLDATKVVFLGESE